MAAQRPRDEAGLLAVSGVGSKKLDTYGAAELERAIGEALEHDSPHLPAVRQILDRRRHERGQPPPIPVRLPDDPRLNHLAVRTHALTDYEQLQQEVRDDD